MSKNLLMNELPTNLEPVKYFHIALFQITSFMPMFRDTKGVQFENVQLREKVEEVG